MTIFTVTKKENESLPNAALDIVSLFPRIYEQSVKGKEWLVRGLTSKTKQTIKYPIYSDENLLYSTSRFANELKYEVTGIYLVNSNDVPMYTNYTVIPYYLSENEKKLDVFMFWLEIHQMFYLEKYYLCAMVER